MRDLSDLDVDTYVMDTHRTGREVFKIELLLEILNTLKRIESNQPISLITDRDV